MGTSRYIWVYLLLDLHVLMQRWVSEYKQMYCMVPPCGHPILINAFAYTHTHLKIHPYGQIMAEGSGCRHCANLAAYIW